MGQSLILAAPTLPGSDERWNLLVPRRHRLVLFCSSRLADALEAEDCAHEALLRTLEFQRLDEPRVGQFLTTVAARLCVDRHRAIARGRRAALRTWDGGHQEGPEDRICDQMAGRWLFDVLDTLPPQERAVLSARADGLSTREAASRLGISDKAAESAFTRGRARLRAYVAGT